MNPEQFIAGIKTEHLISMAVGFIFVVSAAASLIISANGKIDRISSRFRHTCELWRATEAVTAGGIQRRLYLNEQIKHFHLRYTEIQRVLRYLFIAICVFIGAYFFYIVMCVFIVINMSQSNPARPPQWMITSIEGSLAAIAVLFVSGMALMLMAARLQVIESGDSDKTLTLERQDIDDFYKEYKEVAPNKSLESTP